ncbi:TonB-dependent receptor [Confluentibacter citreus]|uniref:TonB-dependent receptor n=1 Tax=Confluentibacter citreus TaxID=2007307 RepID=UPI001EFC7C6E|nr:carboxypeptidase-like regulatory domain-containing protein [Confluentibacter citreus]
MFLFIMLVQYTFGQTEKKISITFENVNRMDALLQLEKEVELNFYFIKEWFDESLISKSFNNENIADILTQILEGTPLNFLIIDYNVILTKNNLIVDQLPPNFFGEEKTKTDNEVTSAPILQRQYVRNSNVYTDSRVYSVGKENKSSLNTSHTVSGYIKDFKTQLPLENVAIFVKEGNVNTVTDANGYYRLKLLAGLNILETSSLTYGKTQKQVVVYGDGSLSFDLIESLEQLEEVVIDANKDDNIRTIIAGVTKIDIQGIKNIPLVLGERDILKIATTMPGIKTAGEGALGYNVRGGKVDQNLILFDHAVIYNPAHFFGVFSAINPFVSGSVDIYKGNIPAEFGGRLSSVIDISTKEGNKEKLSGEGSIGPVTGNLSIETPIVKGKSSLMMGVRATYSDWILKSISEESIKNSSASFYDGVIKYEDSINSNNKLQITSYTSRDMFSISSDSVFSYGNLLGSIKWGHKIDNKNSVDVILASSQYKFNIEYDGNFNRNFDYGYKINETELKLIAKYNHSKKHKFDYGISSKLYNIQPGYMKPLGDQSVVQEKKVQKEKGLESALFVSDLIEVNDKLSFDVGLRFSTFLALGPKNQNIYNTSQPISNESVIETKVYKNNDVIKAYGGPEIRLSGRYFLSPSLSVKAGYNTTIQYSHLLSTNTTASPVDSWKLSDLNIKPQKAQQLSVGLFKNFDDDSHEVSIEGYYKKMKNLLDFKVGAELILNENIETELLPGVGKAYGVEFLLKKKKGRLNGWLGYSFSRTLIKLDSPFLTNQVNNGEYFAANQDRPHDFNIISNYRITKRYSVAFNFNYQSGRPITYPVGKYTYAGTEYLLYSDRNKYRVPDYYRLDIGVNIEGNHKNVKLAHSFVNISVYNVLGRNNPYSVFFVNENGSIQAYQSSIFSVPVPTITYNFKF